jgi:hypothetical protein
MTLSAITMSSYRKPACDWFAAKERAENHEQDAKDAILGLSGNGLVTFRIRRSMLQDDELLSLLTASDFVELREYDGTTGVVKDVWGGCGLSQQEQYFMRKGLKIAAIKSVRTRRNSSLLDAKEFVENEWKKIGAKIG